MKIPILLCAFLCAALCCAGQRGYDPCSRKIYTYTDNPTKEDLLVYSNNLDSFVTRYVALYFPDCLEYITPGRAVLTTVPLNISLDNYMYFNNNDSNNISITMERVWKNISLTIDSLDLLQITKDFATVLKINHKLFFGNVYPTKSDTIFSVSEIKKIEVVIAKDTVNISQNLFQDLISPNFQHQYKSFKPAEVYWDKLKRLVYIYIYGDFPDAIADDDYFERNGSFLCKLIIEPNGQTHRIVIPTRYLKYYGWIKCEDFWGF